MDEIGKQGAEATRRAWARMKRRDRKLHRRRHGMKMSGRSVQLLQQIIIEKSQAAARRRGEGNRRSD